MHKQIFIVFVVLLGFSTSAYGQKVHKAWYDRADSAYVEGRYSDAAELYQRITKQDKEDPEIYYRLAKSLFEIGEDKAADRAINRALRRDPGNVSFMELQLEIGFPRILLYILRVPKKNELARNILKIDSTSAVANGQLGGFYMGEWLDWQNRLTVNNISVLNSGWLASTEPNVENEVALGDDKIKREFTDDIARQLGENTFDTEKQEVAGREILYLDERAKKAYPDAEFYLQRAVASEPDTERFYLDLAQLYTSASDMKSLSRLANTMKKEQPESYHSWLMGGYVMHESGNARVAETRFNKALTLMPDSIRAVYMDTGRLMNKESRASQVNFNASGFWEFRDPRMLTPENERVAEHYARVFFSSLQYSEPKINLQGWDSERGEIYIRYGKPVRQYKMDGKVADCGATTYDRFHIFEYGENRFVFGNLYPQLNSYVFYSPCSQVVSGRDAIAKDMDFVMKAEEIIREEPESYTQDSNPNRVQFPYQLSTFKAEDGGVDVYVPYGVPVVYNALLLEQSLDLRAGAFLLSEEDETKRRESLRSMSTIKMSQVTQFDGATLWLDALHMSASPGDYALSVEFETKSGKGAGYYREEITVDGYDSSTFQLSDLLLAYAVEEAEDANAEPGAGLILRDGLLIKPAPWGVFSTEQPLYLYFETYNMALNNSGQSKYEIETVLVPRGDGKGLSKVLEKAFRRKGKGGVSTRFENTSQRTDEGQYLIVDTTDQPAGAYVLALRVLDKVSGQKLETQRLILLE